METHVKDIWDKITAVSALVASVLIPIVIAVIGQKYATGVKQSENRVKYTELAISILREQPKPENEDIRGWAIDVVNQYSEVPMTSQLKSKLLRSRLVAQDLSGSDFENSNLRFARFDRAAFDSASLRMANFENADFDGSVFRGAKFDHADLRGADLSGAVLDKSTKLPK